MDVAGCDFTVLRPILETVAHSKKEGVYEMKSLDQELTESLEFTSELLTLIKTRIKQLENSVNKAKKSDFLKTGQEVKHSKNSATMEEIKKAFMAVVTSLNKALTENHVLH